MVLFCMMYRPLLTTNELRSSTIGIASSLKDNSKNRCVTVLAGRACASRQFEVRVCQKYTLMQPMPHDLSFCKTSNLRTHPVPNTNQVTQAYTIASAMNESDDPHTGPSDVQIFL